MPSAAMNFVFPPAAQPYLTVAGSQSVFPVRRIYCVGRNYAAHVVEMGGDPNREAPFFFQKNPSNLVIDGGDFPYPDKSSDVHHEIEMVIALHGGGRNIAIGAALGCIFGYAVGLDMTRRDLQNECKQAARPWEVAKAFEHSAPCSALRPATEIGHPDQGVIWLKVNGTPRQEGNLNQLIWKTPEIISYLSGLFELAPGDLIFTGTPSGVGAVQRGDVLLGGVDGVGEIRAKVA
jgi:fumarylpyruvate hydrolase